MINDCLGFVDYLGHRFKYDHCSSVIYYDIDMTSKFTKDSLIHLSKVCFDAYKFRLEEISAIITAAGTNEYNLINERLIDLILPFEPLKFSFSITQDPSLHFFIRFPKRISLFVETFLDIEEGHDTYIQILKSGDVLLEKNSMFDDALFEISDFISNEYDNAPRIKYLKETKFLNVSDRCQPYQKDSFLVSKR